MTFIVRTRMGDIDVNSQNLRLGRKELLDRARRLVKRALEVGERAEVFERSSGREVPIDPITGKYLTSSEVSNVVASGLQRRGGAGAGLHGTRTRDEATGRSRRSKHGGRAGRTTRRNPDAPFEFDAYAPKAPGPARRAARPMPGSEEWKALSSEEREEIKAEMAMEMAAALQNVPLEALQRVLAEGRPSYPKSERPKNPFGLTIYSDIEDVRAAASALGIPVSNTSLAAKPDAVIVVSAGGAFPEQSGAKVFRFPTTPIRPMVPYVESRKSGDAGTPQAMGLFSSNLAKLAGWISDNNFHKLEILAPTPDLVSRSREAEIVSGPYAGDVLYFLATLFSDSDSRAAQRVQTSAIEAPVSGKIVDVQPAQVVIEDGRNYAAEFDAVVNRVNSARRAIYAGRERTRARFGRRRREIEQEIERTTDELLQQARGLKVSAPDVRSAIQREVGRAKDLLLSQHAAALRAVGKQYHDSPITYDDAQLMQNAAVIVAQSMGRRTDIYEYAVGGEAQNLQNRIIELRAELFHLNSQEIGATDPALDRLEAEFFGRGARGGENIAALVPALAKESNRGYPSLSPSATVDDVERAIRALFGRPDAKVVVTVQGAPFATILVPKNPSDAMSLAQFVGREKELERDLSSLTNQLRLIQERDPSAVAALVAQIENAMAGDPSGVKMGQVFGSALGGSLVEPTAEQNAAAEVARAEEQGVAVSAELKRLHERIKGMTSELRKAQRSVNELSTEAIKFTGRIAVRVPVSLRGQYGRNLPLLPSITLGSTVQEGQPLTGADVVVETPAAVAPRRAAAPSIVRTVPTSPRLTEKEADAIANLGTPSADKPVKRLHAALSTNLREGDTGQFVVQKIKYEGSGKDRHVAGTEDFDAYARVISPRALNFTDVLDQVGGFGPFLVAFGYMPEADQAKLPAELRASKTLSEPALAILVEKVIGPKNRPMVEWVTGQRNLNILELSANPPAGVSVGDVAAQDVPEQGIIRPAYPAAGKAVKSSEIEKLVMYTMRQERPTEAAPVIFEVVEVMPRGGSFNRAIAEVVNRYSKLKKHTESMVRAVATMSKQQRTDVITDEDKAQAATRARAFGNNKRDIDYVTSRLLRAKLTEASADFPEIREQVGAEQGIKTSAITKLVETLRRGDRARYGSVSPDAIIRSFTPTSAEVEEGIEALREKIADPRVTEDPMMDLLLVAHLAPDASGRPRDLFELIVDWRTLNLLRGQTGTGLSRLIKAFEFSPQIGYVPSEYPKTKAELSALSTLANAQGLSTRSAVAAARLGLNFSPRGEFSVAKISPQGRGRAGLDLPGGIVVEHGGRGELPHDVTSGKGLGRGTFGQIGSARTNKSRRDILMSRLPREVSQAAIAPQGRSEGALERIRGQYARSLDAARKEGRYEDIPSTQREAAIVRARNDAAIAAAVQSASGLTDAGSLAFDAFFGDDTTIGQNYQPGAVQEEPEAESNFAPFALDNPYRRARLARQEQQWTRRTLRRNPSVAAEFSAARKLPPSIAAAFEAVGAIMKFVGTRTADGEAQNLQTFIASALTPEQITVIQRVNIISAVASWVMGILSEKGSATDIERAVAKFSGGDAIKAILTFNFASGAEPPSVSLGSGPSATEVPLTKTALTSIRAELLIGIFYEFNQYGALDLRQSRQVASIIANGPFAAAWVASNASRLAGDPVALQSIRESSVPQDDINAVEAGVDEIQTFNVVGDGDNLGALRRLITLNAARSAVVMENGFILTPSSKALLPRITPGVDSRSATSIADLHVRANEAYTAFLEAIMVSGRVDTDKAAAAGREYEERLSSLQQMISANEDTSPAFRSTVEAMLVHFLTGRVRPGEERISKDRRLAALKGPLASYLDFYGRPLFPIPAETLTSLGLPAINYGDGATLGSRITLPQARHIIDQTSGRGAQRSASTSTLDCKAGVGRGISEFPRPFTGYRPSNWPEKGLLNVIWVSPNGQVARIYRLGAAVCMFRRKQGEKLGEFLSEVAENWNLWLTDPEHKRMGKQYASEIWIGQSGDPAGYMYRINTSSDKANLSRNTLGRRLSEAGGKFDEKESKLVTAAPAGSAATQRKIDSAQIAVWGTADEIEADARTYVEALQAGGLLTDVDAEAMLGSILSSIVGAGSAQAASAAASRAAQADLIVLFPPTSYMKDGDATPTGGSFTIPTDFEETVSAFLLNPNSPYKLLRIYDRSFMGPPRSVAVRFAARKLTDAEMTAPATIDMLRRTPAGALIVQLMAEAPVTGRNLRIVAGEAQPKERPNETELERSSDGSITFDPSVAKINPRLVGQMLSATLASVAPILLVETQDVPRDRSNADRDGLAMLYNDDPSRESVYKKLGARAPNTPVLYAYPSVRGDAAVKARIERIKEAVAAALGLTSDQIPLQAVSYERLAEIGPRSLRRQASNPRQRMVRQVASQWMRTYPFVG